MASRWPGPRKSRGNDGRLSAENLRWTAATRRACQIPASRGTTTYFPPSQPPPRRDPGDATHAAHLADCFSRRGRRCLLCGGAALRPCEGPGPGLSAWARRSAIRLDALLPGWGGRAKCPCLARPGGARWPARITAFPLNSGDCAPRSPPTPDGRARWRAPAGRRARSAMLARLEREVDPARQLAPHERAVLGTGRGQAASAKTQHRQGTQTSIGRLTDRLAPGTEGFQSADWKPSVFRQQ